MGKTNVTDQDSHSRGYLETAHSLTRELELAMLAISRNALAELQESIGRQEKLTAKLQGYQRQLRTTRESPSVTSTPELDHKLAAEMVLAHAELQVVNRVYEAVLRHSNRSTSLMASLLNSFQGHMKEASGARLKYQTWSCQM